MEPNSLKRNNSGCSGCIILPIPIGCALAVIILPLASYIVVTLIK